MNMTVLVVDDEEGLAQGLSLALKAEGYEVSIANSLGSLFSALKDFAPDIVLLDVKLPDGDGISAIPHILKRAPESHVIVITAYGDSPTIVRAIQEGAYNFLDKPFPLEALKNMVNKAAESINLKKQISRMREEGKALLIGSSPVMTKVREYIAKVAPHPETPLLIEGESGTGKEVAARLIHEMSRATGNFVGINCAAIPEQLLEAELFGYKRGAYTGAAHDKVGLIKIAEGGTLFLDEIADMPLGLQGKLLRFLDSRTIRPLGGVSEERINTRVICATCNDLEARVREDKFRADLYYRISTLLLCLPALRERGRDVIELAYAFMADFNTKLNRHTKTLTPEVEEVFLSYSWPGNVRELKNLVERILILKEQGDLAIRLSDLPEEMLEFLPSEGSKGDLRDSPLKARLDEAERQLIEEALKEAKGNKSQAARLLGLSRYALLRRLQHHGMA